MPDQLRISKNEYFEQKAERHFHALGFLDDNLKVVVEYTRMTKPFAHEKKIAILYAFPMRISETSLNVVESVSHQVRRTLDRIYPIAKELVKTFRYQCIVVAAPSLENGMLGTELLAFISGITGRLLDQSNREQTVHNALRIGDERK